MRRLRIFFAIALALLLCGCSAGAVSVAPEPLATPSAPATLEQYTETFRAHLDLNFLSDAIKSEKLTAAECESLSPRVTAAVNNAAYTAAQQVGAGSVTCNVGGIPEYALLAILNNVGSPDEFEELLPVSITQSQDGFYIMLNTLRTGELFQAFSGGDSYLYLKMRAEYSAEVTKHASAIPVADESYSITPPVSNFSGAVTSFNAKKSIYGVELNSGSAGRITAAADGTVIAAGSDSSVGNYIVLRDSEFNEYIYTGLSELIVETGDKLLTGAKLCKKAKKLTFRFYVAHRSGAYIDPSDYMKVQIEPSKKGGTK